jgi:hypothetical protein
MASKSISAKCGHIKRKLTQNEPLADKTLEFALEVIDYSYSGFSDSQFLDKLAEKLKSREELNDYEYHIMVDVLLVHRKLSV